MEAGLEFAEELDAGKAAEVSSIYLPFGTGGTVAGLAVGLAAAGVMSEIVAVRVTAKALANRHALKSLIKKVVANLRACDTSFPDVADLALQNVRIDSNEYGAGYGLPTASGKEAEEKAARDKLTVETTYTAKALASLIRETRARGKDASVLYWHTLSSADLSPLLRMAPPIPKSVERYLNAP